MFTRYDDLSSQDLSRVSVRRTEVEYRSTPSFPLLRAKAETPRTCLCVLLKDNDLGQSDTSCLVMSPIGSNHDIAMPDADRLGLKKLNSVNGYTLHVSR